MELNRELKLKLKKGGVRKQKEVNRWSFCFPKSGDKLAETQKLSAKAKKEHKKLFQ